MKRPVIHDILMARVAPVLVPAGSIQKVATVLAMGVLVHGLSQKALAQSAPAAAGPTATPTPVHAASATGATPAPGAAASEVKPATESDNKTLKAIDDRYQKASAITMNVQKELKLGLLGQTRSSKGKLQVSTGRLRMELEGAERSLLVIGKRKFWAVTFPAPEFKNAVPQVIIGDIGTKKARSQSLVAALTSGGLTKSFKATGVQQQTNGDVSYFLQPKGEQGDFKRAQVTLSKDRKKITGLRYWDERDNESNFVFSSIEFGTKPLSDKLFNYVPPANADVMNY